METVLQAPGLETLSLHPMWQQERFMPIWGAVRVMISQPGSFKQTPIAAQAGSVQTATPQPLRLSIKTAQILIMQPQGLLLMPTVPTAMAMASLGLMP